MLTAVNMYTELVHFIILFIFLSNFNLTCKIMCFVFLHWDELNHGVYGGRIYCGVHFVSMWQKEKHAGVPKHNAQSGEKSLLLHHAHSLLTSLCTKYSKYDIFPTCSVMTPRVSLDFPQATYCLFRSAVACNCETIHLLSFWGVWMWLKSFDMCT